MCVCLCGWWCWWWWGGRTDDSDCHSQLVTLPKITSQQSFLCTVNGQKPRLSSDGSLPLVHTQARVQTKFVYTSHTQTHTQTNKQMVNLAQTHRLLINHKFSNHVLLNPRYQDFTHDHFIHLLTKYDLK